MFFRAAFEGLQAKLGGFGRGIIERLQTLGQSVASALGLAKVAGVEVVPGDVVREWDNILIARSLEPDLLLLKPDETIPQSFYEPAGDWQQTRYLYGYSARGKDLATGEEIVREFHFGTKRAMLPREILEEGRRLLTPGPETLGMQIYDERVMGATHREGETW